MRVLIYPLFLISVIACKDVNLIKENESLLLEKERVEMEIKNRDKDIEEKNIEIALLKQELKFLKNGDNGKPQKKLSQHYLEAKSSVYLIYTTNNKNISQGSAFAISPDGLAISNYHVFKNASDAIAINSNGDRLLISEIIEANKSDDYVIFRLGPLSQSIPYLSMSQSKSDIGDNVFAIGNPKGLTQTLSTGIISGYRKNLIQTTTEITHGSSGGPLFNQDGKVVGITTSGLGEANLNFAIDISTLKLDLNKSENERSSTSLKNRDLVTLMEKYYNTLMNEDLKSLNNFYAKKLSRFHGLYKIDKSIAIKDHKNYLSKFLITHISIIPNTLKVYSGNDEYILQYEIDYRIMNKKTDRKKSYTLSVVSVVTNNGNIKSIYDNILKLH